MLEDFKLKPSYFDLTKLVYKCFNTILPKAQNEKIMLMADVQKKQHMDFISNIYTDKDRLG